MAESPSVYLIDLERAFEKDPPPASFRKGPIELRGLRIDLTGIELHASSLTLRMTVPDRDTRRPRPLEFNVAFPVPVTSDEELAVQIRNAAAAVVAHELAELLLFHGRRDDPHAPLGIKHLREEF